MYFKLRGAFYAGNAFYCPICERSSRKFLTAGTNLRGNAKCPRCSSLERDRFLKVFLDKRKLPVSGSRLLHIAPERCLFDLFERDSSIKYLPADKFEPGYSYPRGTVNIDITKIDSADNHYDLIICNHVLEHVPEDRKAMRELRRVLNPGGTAILNVPIDMSKEATFEDFSITDPNERLKHFGQHDHVRIYGRDYALRLAEAGFEVEQIEPRDIIEAAEQRRCGIIDRDYIFSCRKGNS